MRVRRLTGAFAVFCLAAGLMLPSGVAAETPPGTLITGMTVGYTNLDHDLVNHPASMAIDGDPSTAWLAGAAAGVLNVDLGAPYWVSGIEVLVAGNASKGITLWGESVGRLDAVGYGGFPGPIPDGTLLQQTTTYQPFPMQYVSVVMSMDYWLLPMGIYEVRVYGTAALHYDFTGFFAPVDNGVLNVAKAGSAIPVKFSLGGDQGLDIFAAGYPKAVRISCDTGESADAVEEYVVASTSGLKYDAASGRYQYNWKTTKGVTGCFRLELGLKDGSLHTADFRLK